MERQLERIQPLLDTPFIRRTRRNHGLEHATIHLLSRRIPNLKMAGRSDSGGFFLFGEADTEQIEGAVHNALERMRNGEAKLAIHPNCGTNLVSIALLGTAAVGVMMIGAGREKNGIIGRLPMVAVGIMGAVLFGQPLGLILQEHVTTSGDPADLEIVDIKRSQRGSLTVHRITTRSS